MAQPKRRGRRSTHTKGAGAPAEAQPKERSVEGAGAELGPQPAGLYFKILREAALLTDNERAQLLEHLEKRAEEKEEAARAAKRKLAQQFITELKKRHILQKFRKPLKEKVKVPVTLTVEFDWDELDIDGDLSTHLTYDDRQVQEAINKYCEHKREKADRYYRSAAADLFALAREMDVDLGSKAVYELVYAAVYNT